MSKSEDSSDIEQMEFSEDTKMSSNLFRLDHLTKKNCFYAVFTAYQLTFRRVFSMEKMRNFRIDN